MLGHLRLIQNRGVRTIKLGLIFEKESKRKIPEKFLSYVVCRKTQNQSFQRKNEDKK